MHKSSHLLLLTLILGTDGCILDICGPHFSDFYNNDAGILQVALDDGSVLSKWVEEALQGLVMTCEMSALLEQGQRRLIDYVNSTRRQPN